MKILSREIAAKLEVSYLCVARGQFFKRIFAPTEKFAPAQYSANAIVRVYASFKNWPLSRDTILLSV
jgi:hypothetical protein